MRAALIVVAVCVAVFETSAVRSGIRNGIRSRRSYDRWLEIISQLSKRSGANGNSLSAFPIEFPFADKDGRYSALPLLVLPYPVPVPDHSSRGECSAKNHEFDVRLGNSQFAQEDYAVTMPGPVSSAYLIEVFKEQQPQAPELPPAVISPPPQIVYPSIQASRGYLPPQRDAQPSLPRFDRSMVLHGFLTVFKADYTEQYTVWYDANTAAARVEYHEGATSCYRMMMSNNRIKRSTMTTDRTTGQDSIVCGVTTPVRASGDDRQTPGLPDTEGFTFAGYKQEFGGQAEVWTREVQGGPGELGAAQGESLFYHHELLVHRRADDFTVPLRRAGSCSGRVAGLPPRAARAPAWRRLHCATQVSNNLYQATRRHVEVWTRKVQGGPGELGAAQGESLVYHHELLVHRRGDDFTVPLRYTVNIDSSVLGPQCDGYEHIYSSYQEKEHNDDEFRFSERQCDEKETLDPINKEHMARLDPIREFTLPTRASIHDELFAKFTKDFDRTYADADEEALRKNLLTQRTRFIASCNRQGATFSVGHNFLSDRLDEEISEILGVTFSAEAENNTLSFSSATGGSGSKQLPKEWDWRPKGAVSSVKFQGAACSSCWAFAVTGSVEGALFIKTKKLVELSVQALVDCSKSHGAHGCNKIGTWPVHAYNYVKDRGLPAVGDYAAYDEKDHECKAPPSEPTTHIEGGVDIPPNNIDALKTAIRYEAPAVLVVDAQAKSFISYKTGVLKDDRCKKGPKKKLNHAVLTVGWGEQNGEPHFIIKNSWSAVWGEGGYIRLHAPSNTCGVLTVPSFAKLQRPNIDKLPAGASNTDYDENRR